tara:strand:- start:777 stop:1103 length:327 start_codon:yes stop_codon:yes gene_type:complete
MRKIKHGRIKPKWKPTPNTEEKAYHDWLRQLGCVVCQREPSIHHVISDGYKRLSKSHWHCTPLCYDHHQNQEGYHSIGHKQFVKQYDIDLHEKASELLLEYEIQKEEK